MQFPTYSSPHLPVAGGVADIMRKVIYALIPAILCAGWFFGWGVLFNLLVCILTALLAEAAVLGLRRRPILASLGDGSALVTACLLAVALPPFAPWWIAVIGCLFAMVFAKHLYGGLGYNPFNPAMVGYVVLLISFPREMTQWAPPQGLGDTLDFGASLALYFSGQLPAGMSMDALSMATPLDAARTQLNLGRTLGEIRTGPQFGHLGGVGWEWVNLCLLGGGLWMLNRRVIHWQIPVAMLGSLFIIAFLYYFADPDTYLSPLFHLFSGATMLGAFFIATDPVSAATTPRGRLVYGAGIGLLVYIIRTWGGYPDGVAFAVLLMNMAAPTIDHYTQPRVFGQGRK